MDDLTLDAAKMLSYALITGDHRRCHNQVALCMLVDHWQQGIFLETDPPDPKLLPWLKELERLTQQTIKTVETLLDPEEVQ